jgi:glutaredoxin-like protein NrdH
MEKKHIDGADKGELLLFTLSTCIWCKKTKSFLKDLGVGYDFVEVDNLRGDDKDKAMDEVRRFNPDCSFPSLVIDGKECIVGFDEDKIKKTRGL